MTYFVTGQEINWAYLNQTLDRLTELRDELQQDDPYESAWLIERLNGILTSLIAAHHTPVLTVEVEPHWPDEQEARRRPPPRLSEMREQL